MLVGSRFFVEICKFKKVFFEILKLLEIQRSSTIYLEVILLLKINMA